MTSPDCENGFSDYDTETLTGKELLGAERDKLDEIFSAAELPEPDELSGRYTCVWLAGPEYDSFPAPLKKLYNMVAASPVFPWKGMEFAGTSDGDEIVGINLILNLRRGLKLFDFNVRTEPSEFDGMDCLAFDYDTEKNILFFKKLRDELRRVNPNLYLGRGNIVKKGEARLIAYFTLEPE